MTVKFVTENLLTAPLASLADPLSEELVVERLWIDKHDDESVDELLFLEVRGRTGGKIS